LRAQLEALFVLLHIHGVREWQLFEVVLREKSDFLKHSGESTSCHSTTRETENTDFVLGTICWV